MHPAPRERSGAVEAVMQDRLRLGKRVGSRIEAIAWKFTLGLFGVIPVFLAGFLLLLVIQAPKAASAQWTPTWRWSWDTLAQDDSCPTPDSGYCDATLSRQRLCCGPLEIRYSYVY